MIWMFYFLKWMDLMTILTINYSNGQKYHLKNIMIYIYIVINTKLLNKIMLKYFVE